MYTLAQTIYVVIQVEMRQSSTRKRVTIKVNCSLLAEQTVMARTRQDKRSRKA